MRRSVSLVLPVLLTVACAGQSSMPETTSASPGASSAQAAPTPENPSPTLAPAPSFTPQPVTFDGWIADNRPAWIAFVLPRGSTVTGTSYVGSTQIQQQYPDGLEIVVVSDGKGSTQQTQQDFNLGCGGSQCRLGQPFTTPLTRPDGSLVQLRFKPATQDEWNQLLAQWQSQLRAVYQAQQQAAAAAREAQAQATARANTQDKLNQEARHLQDDVSSIQQTGIPSDLQKAADLLTSEGKTIQRMQADLGKEKTDAAVRPLSYQQVNLTVYQDYNLTLYQDYNSALYQERSQFSSIMNDLKGRIDTGHKTVLAMQQEIADLDAAAKTGFTVTADQDGARAALTTYQATLASAEKQMPQLQAQQDPIKSQADDIMSQGKDVFNAAAAACKC